MIVDAERDWVFGKDRAQNLPRFTSFPANFVKLCVIWKRLDVCFGFGLKRSLNVWTTSSKDMLTRILAKRTQSCRYMHFGGRVAMEMRKIPVRFTKSSDKVLSNLKSGSFEPYSVAELIYQSNKNVEPVIEWDPHSRRKFVYKISWETAQTLLK